MASNCSPLKKQKLSVVGNAKEDDTWRDKCVKKFNLSLSATDCVTQDVWEKYYNERSAFVYNKICDDCKDDKQRKENSAPQSLDNTDNKYYDTAGQWMDDACHNICYFNRFYDAAKKKLARFVPGLQNSFYIKTLGYLDGGDGPDMPLDIEAVTVLYSATNSNYVEFDFNYHNRLRSSYVESYSSLTAKLCNAECNDLVKEIVVYSYDYEERKKKKLIGLPDLKKIQMHLFAGVSKFKKPSKSEASTVADKKTTGKRKEVIPAIPPCNGNELLPCDMFRLLLVASMFDINCQETDCGRMYSWVEQDGAKKFN